MTGFLQKKKISKCDSCPVKKKNLKEIGINNLGAHKKVGNGEILIILDMIEFKQNYTKLEQYLQEIKVDNYTIVHALDCRSKNFELPSPISDIYKKCNCIDIKNYNPKVVITMGRSIYSITKNNDLASWYDFREYQFNQTYFYHEGIRVYPIAAISEWISKDNFAKHFVKKQFIFIKKYLRDYKKEVFEDYKLHYVEDPNSFLMDNMDQPIVAWDTETNSLDHFKNDFSVKCMTISFDGYNGYYLPFDKISKRVLLRFFSKDREYITANGKFDVKALYMMDIQNAKSTHDVILLFHLLNTDRLKNSLKSLSWLINFGGYDKELDEYVKKHKIKNYSQIPEKILMNYATLDAIVTYRIWKKGMELSKKQSLVYKNYREVVIPVIEVFTKMEIEGMRISKERLNEFNENLETKIKELEIKIQKILGNVDINSNQQLARALEDFGLPAIEKSDKQFYIDNEGNKKYFYKTGIENLKLWQKQGHEIAELLVEYRKNQKMKNSFVGNLQDDKELTLFNNEKLKEEGIVKFIRDDGKLHPVYGPARTSSMRGVCLSGEALIATTEGEVKLKHLQDSFKTYKVLTHENNYKNIKNFYNNGEQLTYKITLQDGKILKCTKDHQIFTNNGWKKLEDLDLENDLVGIQE